MEADLERQLDMTRELEPSNTALLLAIASKIATVVTPRPPVLLAAYTVPGWAHFPYCSEPISLPLPDVPFQPQEPPELVEVQCGTESDAHLAVKPYLLNTRSLQS